MRRLVLASLQVEDSPEAIPLGAASVAAALLARHRDSVELRLVDALVSEGCETLVGRIRDLKPDWVGFSVYTWSRSGLARAALLIKELFPAVLLFAGGPEATADPEGLMAEAPYDFLVLGEGEEALCEVLGALLAAGPDSTLGALASLPPIRGVYPRGSTEVPARAAPPSPEALASPWLSGLLDPRARGGVLWELARGCPFKCAYCYESKGESGVRPLPLARIEAELALFAAAAPLAVFVLDPTFNADRKRALALLGLFRERAPGLRWKFEIRAEFVDRELARAFSALDCSLQVGLQSSDPEVLAAVGRPGFDSSAFSRKMRILDEAGLVYGLDLIYGLPGDDLRGFRRSLDFALSLAPNHLDLFPLAVLQGTVLAERAAELGLVVESGPPHLLLSSPGFPAADLSAAASLARACDLFYSRGRAVAWFRSALAPLGIRPSAFLGRFAERVRAAEPPPAGSPEIEELQLAFLESEYRAKGREALLPALSDIVRFNGAYGRAVAEGIASRVELSYDPDEVLGPAGLDLAAFARAARPRPCAVEVAPGDNGVRITRKTSAAPRKRRR